MTKRGIRTKLRRSFVIMVSIGGVLSSLIAFFVSKEFIESRFISEIETTIFATEQILQDTFNDADHVLLGLAEQLDRHSKEQALDDKDILNYIILSKSSIPTATTLFLGTEKKAFYMYPSRYIDDTYDPRVRTWYLLAKGEPQTLKWSEPYKDVGTGELVVTGSYYLNWKGKPYDGVIGVDILLSDIESLLKKTRFGQSGELMLISKDNNILITKDTLLLQQPLANVNPALVDLENSTRFSDAKYMYFKKTLENDAYYCVARISHRELTTFSFILLFSIAGAGVLMFFLVLLISDRIAKGFAAPLLALTQTMREAKSGNYDIQCTASADDEVGELITGYNEMLVAFNEHHMEITALYEELYASEETLKAQYDELYENREHIRASEKRYKDIFDASKEGLWTLDANNNYALYSTEWYKLYDINLENTILADWQKLIHPEDKQIVDEAIDNHIKYRTNVYTCEYRVINRNGEYRWIHSVGKASFDAKGKWYYMVGSHVDITERKETDARIHRLAYKDTLTNLGNRFALQDFLEREILLKHEGAILFVDIDNFKYINDTFGHPIGDQVLIETANRLGRFIENDMQLARFSGDEFLMVLCGLTQRSELEVIVKQILNALKEELLIDDRGINISTSIGITFYPSDAKDLTELLRFADLAMYAAKERAGVEYAFYDEQLRSKMMGKIQMENYLRSALAYDEIFVLYQPIVSLPNQNIVGFEALVRWRHPDWGLVSPDQFIPVAEKNGFIIPLGMFVLESALVFIQKMNQNRRHKLTVAVNISVVQLTHLQFEANVIKLLEKHNISPSVLKLEVTESLALEQVLGVNQRLMALKQLGVGISLDDFGSGNSSINNLLNLPLTTLKIDKELVHRMVEDDHVRAMVSAVLSYCHETNIDTIAEGVETKAQLKTLLDMGFNAIQGYYYAKPLSYDQLTELMEEWVHEPFPGGDFS